MKQTENFFADKIVFFALIFLMFVPMLTTGQGAADVRPSDSPVLARIDIAGMMADPEVPVYAHLLAADGKEYALVIAPSAQLTRAGVPFQILDNNAGEAEYFILTPLSRERRTQAIEWGDVLHDDGEQLIIRSTFRQVDRLAESGFDVQWLGQTPIVFSRASQPPNVSITSLDYDANIAYMIGQVTQSTVETYAKNLSGENPVNIGGADYTITTRYTASGTPIEKATQYVYEFMQGCGLTVSYHDWSNSTYSGRNVIGELTGTSQADEIVLITAHLDCVPATGAAPGADDNASGSVGVMLSAQLLSQYQFKRTVRFVFFTGEEQGLIGSYKYAELVYLNNDDIVAVYNMDMISYDAVGGPDLRLHTRTVSNSGYEGDLAIANTFTGVVNAYGLSDNLAPIIDSDGFSISDHNPFWKKGYYAILGTEDHDNDMTPYYHQSTDTVATMNLNYFTNFIKATVGTAAHLAIKDAGALDADFTASPISGTTPLTVNFTDLSTDDPDTWTWVFDGGTPATSTDQHPIITYNTPGTYTVTLTASNAFGCDTEIKFDYITVQSPPCPGTIVNPGFETGTTSGWLETGAVSLTADAHTGSYAVSLDGTDSSLEQIVTGICPNTSYSVSCWGKAKNQAGLYLGVKNYGGEELAVPFSDQRNFVQQSITFTTGPTDTSATLFIIKTGNRFSGTADDFEIIQN